jgi:ABC-type dipeptide/oligopeptide/nickel transport system permease subunit
VPVDGSSAGARAQVCLGGAILVLLTVLAVLAPVVAPYDPRLPIGRPFEPPGPAHLLGTTDIGQDVLSRCIWAARWTLVIAAATTAISTVLSWLAGVTSGFWPRLDPPIIGLADLLLALPGIPLAMLVVTLVRPSLGAVIVTLGMLSWPGFARIVRAQVLGLRTRPYVEAARAVGASEVRVAVRHVMPGTLGLLPAKLVLTVRFAVFGEATLAFLGLGDPSTPSWGGMIGWAFTDPLLFARPTWVWLVGPPAVLIMLTVLATTWLATGLEGGGLRSGRARPRHSLPRPDGRPADGAVPHPPAPASRVQVGLERRGEELVE